MTIDQISEALGSMRAEIGHMRDDLKSDRDNSRESRQLMREDIMEIKETLAHGAGRMTAIEIRIDDIEPTLKGHVASCQTKADQKLGAEHYRKWVYGAIGTCTGILGAAGANFAKVLLFGATGH